MAPPEQSQWFAQEVQPYEPALRAYLLKRFPSVPDHEDLIQETYAKTLRARERGRLTFAKAFLFTTARNAAIDWIRRRRVTPIESIPASEDLPLLEAQPGAAEQIDRQQQLEAVIEAVVALPERCREVMMLRYLDGLETRVIAAQLGIAPETVRVQLFKGVHACIEHFVARGLLDVRVAGGGRP